MKDLIELLTVLMPTLGPAGTMALLLVGGYWYTTRRNGKSNEAHIEAHAVIEERLGEGKEERKQLGDKLDVVAGETQAMNAKLDTAVAFILKNGGP